MKSYHIAHKLELVPLGGISNWYQDDVYFTEFSCILNFCATILFKNYSLEPNNS